MRWRSRRGFEAIQERSDLLLGRKTYEIFAAYWPYYDETAPRWRYRKAVQGHQEVRGLALGRRRYELAGLGAAAGHRRREAFAEEDGPNLVTQGSTEVVHALLANNLVDAISIFMVPVVLGGGKKLFADSSASHSYELTRSRVSSMGLIIGHYERGGEVKVGDTAFTEPSKAERARQERMNREVRVCASNACRTRPYALGL